MFFRNSDRTEKKINHELIPVPYRTAKAFEPAIYRNVAYDVYMNDHFKKYFDKNMLKQHQHIPFMTHNRLIEKFGKRKFLFIFFLLTLIIYMNIKVLKCICLFHI